MKFKCSLCTDCGRTVIMIVKKKVHDVIGWRGGGGGGGF